MFRTKRRDLHMVVEFGPETRKKLLQTNLKMGCLICSSGVPRNFVRVGGGFNKFSSGQRVERTGIWGW
jgi:hypothetical protein